MPTISQSMQSLHVSRHILIHCGRVGSLATKIFYSERNPRQSLLPEPFSRAEAYAPQGARPPRTRPSTHVTPGGGPADSTRRRANHEDVRATLAKLGSSCD